MYGADLQRELPKTITPDFTHKVCLAPSWASVFSTAQHWQILPGFPWKDCNTATHLCYICWSEVEDRKAESFSRACKHPSTFLKDHVLQNTAHRKASCSCSRWAGGRTAAYKEQVLDKVKVGPFYGKGWHTAPILHTTDKHRAEGCDHLPGDLWGETMHKYYLHGRERDCSVRWREEVENCKDRSSCSVEGFCLETISPI